MGWSTVDAKHGCWLPLKLHAIDCSFSHSVMAVAIELLRVLKVQHFVVVSHEIQLDMLTIDNKLNILIQH